MVMLDLGVNEVISLCEIGAITKDVLRNHLANFSKDQIIYYILSQISEQQETQEEMLEKGQNQIPQPSNGDISL